VFENARELATGSLLALGRHTITGMLCAGARQFEDWSRAYRLFSKERIDTDGLFVPAIDEVMARAGEGEPLYVMIDDTIIRKRGRHIPGSRWMRDPLGPAFHTNFVWGQRYLQMSAALPDDDVNGRSRGIPIGFWHAPSVKKPRGDLDAKQQEHYRELKKRTKVSALGASKLNELHERLPDKRIVCAADGGFTNKAMLRNLPDNTVFIGRIRKDAKLSEVPDNTSGPGRRRFYGNDMATPEEIRKDESVSWQQVRAWAADKMHDFDVKVIPKVRWRVSGEKDLLLMIIRPLAYRPKKGGRLLYREPGYLICTDPDMPLEKILQAYLWRWEIELNFRDEKTVMGVGQAQLRNENSVQSAPALQVASYSYLLLAATAKAVEESYLPSRKWYPKAPQDRCSTQRAQALFRSQYWKIPALANKTDFESSLGEARSLVYSSRTDKEAATMLGSAVAYTLK
jgi:hypothetical protein